jgi:hypothetical protein
MDRSEYLHTRAGGVDFQGGQEDLGDALGHCIATLGRYSRDGLRTLSREVPDVRRNRWTAKGQPVNVAHRGGAGCLRMPSGS